MVEREGGGNIDHEGEMRGGWEKIPKEISYPNCHQTVGSFVNSEALSAQIYVMTRLRGK